MKQQMTTRPLVPGCSIGHKSHLYHIKDLAQAKNSKRVSKNEFPKYGSIYINIFSQKINRQYLLTLATLVCKKE